MSDFFSRWVGATLFTLVDVAIWLLLVSEGLDKTSAGFLVVISAINYMYWNLRP